MLCLVNYLLRATRIDRGNAAVSDPTSFLLIGSIPSRRSNQGPPANKKGPR